MATKRSINPVATDVAKRTYVRKSDIIKSYPMVAWYLFDPKTTKYLVNKDKLKPGPSTLVKFGKYSIMYTSVENDEVSIKIISTDKAVKLNKRSVRYIDRILLCNEIKYNAKDYSYADLDEYAIVEMVDALGRSMDAHKSPLEVEYAFDSRNAFVIMPDGTVTVK